MAGGFMSVLETRKASTKTTFSNVDANFEGVGEAISNIYFSDGNIIF